MLRQAIGENQYGIRRRARLRPTGAAYAYRLPGVEFGGTAQFARLVGSRSRTSVTAEREYRHLLEMQRRGAQHALVGFRPLPR
jgi:hypothetical protein